MAPQREQCDHTGERGEGNAHRRGRVAASERIEPERAEGDARVDEAYFFVLAEEGKVVIRFSTNPSLVDNGLTVTF